MGTFSVKMRLSPSQARNGHKPVELDALVDTGSFWSWAPASTLRKLGVKPIETIKGELADGTMRTKKVGEVKVEVQGKWVTTRVVFGNEGTTPLLGAYTLEGLGFDTSPTRKCLTPIKVFPIK